MIEPNLINANWEQTIAHYLQQIEPINGSWLQAIAYALANLPSTSGGTSGATFLSYTVTDYSTLIATATGATTGQFAYVENEQGTKWLPGTLGGTYYGKGLYYYSGGIWSNDLPQIENQLYIDGNLLIGKADLSGATFTGPTIFNNGLTANTINIFDGVAGIGRVLTSDALGNGTWQIPATSGNLTYYLTNDASDISTYYDAIRDIPTTELSVISATGAINNQLLASFSTIITEPGLTYYPAGINDLHIHAANTNSGRETALYFSLFKRTSGGTETLLGTSSLTSVLNTFSGSVGTDLTLTGFTANVTDRIVCKIYADITGVGVAPDISLYLENGTAARFSLAAVSVNVNNYVPYTGALKNLDLGSKSLLSSSVSVSGNSSSDLVRITQTGAGNALVVEDANSPDTSRFVVDATGNVGIGTNSSITKLQISNTATTVSSTLYNTTSDFVTLTAQGSAPGFNIISAGDAETNRGVFKATRSRGTLTTPLVPILNDDTLSLLGAVYDGVTNLSTAGILFEVDGTVTASTAPQRMVFSTGTGSSRTERMRITSDGKVGIGITTPSTPLHIRVTNSPSTNETIARFDVSDSSTAYFAINNGSTIDGVFVPEIIGRQASTTGLNSVTFGGYIDILQDTGTTVPVTIFRSAVAGGTTVSTRPLFDFRNWTTSVMLMTSSGNVGIGITSPTEKLHVSGNTLIEGNLTATNFIGDGSGLTNVSATATVPYGIINAISSGNYLI